MTEVTEVTVRGYKNYVDKKYKNYNLITWVPKLLGWKMVRTRARKCEPRSWKMSISGGFCVAGDASAWGSDLIFWFVMWTNPWV